MQNIYKLIPSNCRNTRQTEKTEKNEANISQELETSVCVLCYRLRHRLPQDKSSQCKTEWKGRPRCRERNSLVQSLLYAKTVMCNTSEQTVLLPKYKYSNAPPKKYVLLLSLSEDS